MNKSGQVQGVYEEWDSRHLSPGLYSLQWNWSTRSAIVWVANISHNGNCEKDMKIRTGKASAIYSAR